MYCRYSDICDKQCEQCEIVKQEKDIANFIKAKNELAKPINDFFSGIKGWLQKICEKWR